MGYVAVAGGQQAIDQANVLLNYYRLKGDSAPLETEQIRDQLRLLVDRVMGEGALYAPTLAALALKQAEGDSIEASLIIRAYRATQSRSYQTTPLDTAHMRVIRRVSAIFQDVPGGQLLGPTRDYTQRLLDFNLTDKENNSLTQVIEQAGLTLDSTLPAAVPKVVDLLRREGLLQESSRPDALVDITRESMSFPAPRSARLQALSRAETGAMMSLAYSSIRGYGDVHPYLAELRVGYVPVYINHPAFPAEVYVGEILVTEAEMVTDYSDGDTDQIPKFSMGYGLSFGHNEIKAISMGILDRTMQSQTENKAPAEDEEFVLYHTDGVEASGFVAHWKLPHYVTFQSSLDRLRKSQHLKEGSINDI